MYSCLIYSYSASKAHVPYYIEICGLSMCTMFFSHYLINGTIWVGGGLLNIKYVFFSLQLLPETFLNPGTNEWDTVRLGFHVYYQLLLLLLLLLGFDEAWNFHSNFSKNSQISDFIKICLILSRVVPCIRTDIHDEAKGHFFFANLRTRLKMICPSPRLDVIVFGFRLRVWVIRMVSSSALKADMHFCAFVIFVDNRQTQNIHRCKMFVTWEPYLYADSLSYGDSNTKVIFWNRCAWCFVCSRLNRCQGTVTLLF